VRKEEVSIPPWLLTEEHGIIVKKINDQQNKAGETQWEKRL
jgi:hypothetical protein